MPGTIANLEYTNMICINAHSSVGRQTQSQGNFTINMISTIMESIYKLWELFSRKDKLFMRRIKEDIPEISELEFEGGIGVL